MKTSTFLGIEKRVLFMMALVSMIALVTLAYRYKTSSPCKPFSITVTSVDFYTGSVIHCTAKTEKEENCTWDFGDSITTVKGSSFASHIYSTSGQYRVYVIVNDQCEQSTIVTIKDRLVSPDENIHSTFICPETVSVNTEFVCMDTSTSATSHEWFLDETGNVNGTGQKISWTFRTPGLKKIYLQINGRNDMQRMKIIRVTDPDAIEKNIEKHSPSAGKRWDELNRLKDKPEDTVSRQPLPAPAEPEVHKMAPVIKPEEMATLFEEVIAGNKSAADLSGYLCGNLNIHVFYNNEDITFKEMCDRLQSIKKLSNVNKPLVLLTKDQYGCIISANVTVSKRTFFDKLLHKKK